MFKVNNKDTRTTPMVSNDVVLASLLLTLNIFAHFSSVSIVKFEQINTGWENSVQAIWRPFPRSVYPPEITK